MLSPSPAKPPAGGTLPQLKQPGGTGVLGVVLGVGLEGSYGQCKPGRHVPYWGLEGAAGAKLPI